MTQFKVGQTVSVPRLQHYGKGFIYMIDPKNASGYTHYVQFKDKVGKLVLPPSLLKAEEIPVKTAKRWVDFNEEDSGEETFIPDDTPSLDMDLHL